MTCRLARVVIVVSFCLSLFTLPVLAQPIKMEEYKPITQNTPQPKAVTISGTIQSKLGCMSDWQPGCEKTLLTYFPEYDVWAGGPWDLPKGDYEYKVALNKSWDENYGADAARGGPNISLSLPAPEKVMFYYDHKTHWVTDSHNSLIVTVTGNFQSKLGCSKDNDPACLRTWLEDSQGTGIYTMLTKAIPPGSYEARVAINNKLANNYEQSSVQDNQSYTFTVDQENQEVYFGYDPKTHNLVISTQGVPRGNLSQAQAHWVSRDIVLWNIAGKPEYHYTLHYDPAANLKLGIGNIEGGEKIDLALDPAGPGQAVLQKFPQLAGFTTLKLPADAVPKVPDILKSQVAVAAWDQNGKLLDATSLQIPGVLDDLFAYTGPLGISFENNLPVLRVWAPTARSVSLLLFADSKTSSSGSYPMQYDGKSGVWMYSGDPSWKNQYYLYEVEVYVPSTGKIEHNLVTDPYSISLAMNSARSQIVDLNDTALQPKNWDQINASNKPPLDAPEEIVIYELHIRDFSISDPTVPANQRGTYLAFTLTNSDGMKHLKALAAAGLTHIQLLPAFDFASVDEDKSTWQTPDPAMLASFPGYSDQQQALVMQDADKDGFNWGYDPYHYSVPEGSYSTNPDGPTRILEFRQMVQVLNQAGLRVVMDVVYNHTVASGQDPRSVLDKVVPGYYYRLNAIGEIETSTCCQNTATEHNMMEKLMIDSLITWATAYKVDGFRFDLMGHLMLSNMLHVRQALDNLTPQKDGIDGKKIYIYGEGWDMGEVYNNARGVNASQSNINGSNIGVFNDRLRDGARGGSAFSNPQVQGFVTGLLDDPNSLYQGSAQDRKAWLLHITDWIKLGLAGNLANYKLTNDQGELVNGDKIDYNGKSAGYTKDPSENVVFVSAHDNETLFDAVQLKAPASASLDERVRMNNLGIDLVMLAQGIPFFHAGDDLLRSKSLDRNSYNSGDWFNRLDFTYQSDNFAVGLPPAGNNKNNWPLMQSILADPAVKPDKDAIARSEAHFQEMLRIRKSTELFRLRNAQLIQNRVKFYNTGPGQIPGLIVMRIANDGKVSLDKNYRLILVLFNANKETRKYKLDEFRGIPFVLHPIQANSSDPVVRSAAFDKLIGEFSIPGRTTAVFVAKSEPLDPVLITEIALSVIAAIAFLGVLAYLAIWRKK